MVAPPPHPSDSTCRGVTEIKVPLTSMRPMGHVAQCPNTPRITPHPQVPRHQSSCRSWQETGGEVVCARVHVYIRLPVCQRCSWTVRAAVLSIPSNSKTCFSTDESAALTHTQTLSHAQAHTHSQCTCTYHNYKCRRDDTFVT